jgi:hypothetical protein
MFATDFGTLRIYAYSPILFSYHPYEPAGLPWPGGLMPLWGESPREPSRISSLDTGR